MSELEKKKKRKKIRKIEKRGKCDNNTQRSIIYTRAEKKENKEKEQLLLTPDPNLTHSSRFGMA